MAEEKEAEDRRKKLSKALTVSVKSAKDLLDQSDKLTKVFESNFKLIEKAGGVVSKTGKIEEKIKKSLEKSISAKEKELRLIEIQNELKQKDFKAQAKITARIGALIKNKVKTKFQESGVGKAFQFAKDILVGDKEARLKEQKATEQLGIEKQDLVTEQSKEKGVKTKALVTAKSGVKPGGKSTAKSFVRKGNEDLDLQKDQTKSLKQLVKSEDKKDGGILGFLSGIAMLIGAGGLLGFFMTGKTEFLFSAVKGFVKAGQLMMKTFKVILSPLEALKNVSKGLGKTLKFVLSPFKAIKGFIKGFGSLVKGIGGTIGKLFGKSAAKGVVKAGTKSGLKKIPGIGAIMGIVFGISRFRKGDIVGGLLEMASGAASIFPVAGTAISLALDAVLLFRDFKMSGGKEPEAVKQGPGILSKMFDRIKSVMSTIGKFLKFISKFSLMGLALGVDGIREKAISKIKNSFSKVQDFFKPVTDWITGIVMKGQEVIANIFTGIGDFFTKIISKALDVPILGSILKKFIDQPDQAEAPVDVAETKNEPIKEKKLVEQSKKKDIQVKQIIPEVIKTEKLVVEKKEEKVEPKAEVVKTAAVVRPTIPAATIVKAPAVVSPPIVSTPTPVSPAALVTTPKTPAIDKEAEFRKVRFDFRSRGFPADVAEELARKKLGIIPGAAHGAIVKSPQKLMVGEGCVPEAIVPLDKIDEVFKELVGGGVIKLPQAVASDPSQLESIRAERDLGNERLENLKEFLKDEFIPELANQLSGKISNGQNQKSTQADVAVSPFGG